MASFTVRDTRGFVYPPKTKRLAPDFFFQPQVYRQSGETLQLPDGDYRLEVRHGPEYRVIRQPLRVQGDATLSVRLQRWIDPIGYRSCDPHIHAAGCAHYNDPTQGVTPETMWRHVLGENLQLAAALNWGPCYYYQRQFAHETRRNERAELRYDVEVSGFGSHKAGHLVLLGLKDQSYADTLEEWPTLGLNTLRWAKRQGAVCGFPHTGWGLEVPGRELPNPVVPKFDGIGACEYIVDVTHKVPGPDGRLVPAVDFLSAGNTPFPWELNIWYHTLNCGFRTALSGETDFPCIMEDRVGRSRSYLKGNDWLRALQQGHGYVGDGRSHIMNFEVSGSEARADVAALLEDALPGKITEAPYWDIGKAAVGMSVPLELVVNGRCVARKMLPADGKLRQVRFPLRLSETSWVALRILPSCHTNALWVGKEPYRPRRASLEWCLKAVEQCWKEKRATYAASEQAQAHAAYEHARKVYRGLLARAR